MFDAVRNNKRIVQIFLILITIPFALWGVESYMRSSGSGAALAEVGGSKVTEQEFQFVMREQQDAMRQALGREFDPAMLETPEMRQRLLDQLVTERVLAVSAQKARMVVTDEQLRDFIAGQPVLQEGGVFSRKRYEDFLRTQNKNQEMFEYGLRKDLVAQQVAAAVSGGAFSSRVGAERWLAAQLEEREIASYTVKPDQFLGQVKLAPDAVQKYYEENKKALEVPEQVRLEYLVLSPDVLAEQQAVTEEQIKSWYDGHKERYGQPEERRASHILIQVPKEATDDQRKAARAKADDLLRKLRQNPADFARLAKENSQDPGSAGNGGDLGFFGRGMMVKPFEDTAFALKENQISDVVTSDFGLHIIKVTGVREDRVKTLDEVRGEIALELKMQGAQRRFAEIAESFTNTVYEQPDSLQPAAEKYKLQPRQSNWIVKGSTQVAAELANEKLLKAVFAEDAVKNKRNTEAVEVAPSTLVAARVVEHKPAAVRPLETVAADIEKRLTREEAGKLARKEAEDALARLNKGEALALQWEAPQALTRGAQGVSAEALRAAFKLDPAKLPGYVGGALPAGGHVIYKVIAVKPAQIKSDDPRVQQLRQAYVRAKGEDETLAYLESLRSRIGVTLKTPALEQKAQ
jgi:peptidyl-prolyl cis-trans isomerase D